MDARVQSHMRATTNHLPFEIVALVFAATPANRDSKPPAEWHLAGLPAQYLGSNSSDGDGQESLARHRAGRRKRVTAAWGRGHAAVDGDGTGMQAGAVTAGQRSGLLRMDRIRSCRETAGVPAALSRLR
jgi:hypothetical protein